MNSVTLSNGLPTTSACFFELLAYSQALGFTNTMETNATLIDDDVTRKLRRFGLAIAAVSLDGFTAEQHDMVRRMPALLRLLSEECERCGALESSCTSTSR